MPDIFMLGRGHNSLMNEYHSYRFFSVKGYHLPKTLGHLLKPCVMVAWLDGNDCHENDPTLLALSRLNWRQP